MWKLTKCELWLGVDDITEVGNSLGAGKVKWDLLLRFLYCCCCYCLPDVVLGCFRLGLGDGVVTQVAVFARNDEAVV